MKNFRAVADLQRSTDLITCAELERKLGYSKEVAYAALSEWHKAGITERLSAGCYRSNLVEHPTDKVIWETIARKLSHEVVVIGAGALERARWYKPLTPEEVGTTLKETIYLATPDKPCTPIIPIKGVVTIPVGRRLFKQYCDHNQRAIANRPPAIAAGVQFSAWVCPADLTLLINNLAMPNPDLINWGRVQMDSLAIHLVRNRLASLPVDKNPDGSPKPRVDYKALINADSIEPLYRYYYNLQNGLRSEMGLANRNAADMSDDEVDEILDEDRPVP